MRTRQAEYIRIERAELELQQLDSVLEDWCNENGFECQSIDDLLSIVELTDSQTLWLHTFEYDYRTAKSILDCLT